MSVCMHSTALLHGVSPSTFKRVKKNVEDNVDPPQKDVLSVNTFGSSHIGRRSLDMSLLHRRTCEQFSIKANSNPVILRLRLLPSRSPRTYAGGREGVQTLVCGCQWCSSAARSTSF
eukprot:scaffold20145_cov103-Isochrysis_galbana.AAC.4